MKIKLIVLACVLVSFLQPLAAQKNNDPKANVFEIKNPDFKRSPYTGMTRNHWKEAGMYLLKGAFSYVKTLDDPMKFPKESGKSYPKTDDQIPTEKIEGLCRTLFIAAPLMKEDSTITLNGIKLIDYYRHQISKLVDPKSDIFVPHSKPEDHQKQELVEFGGLAISMFIAPDLLWNSLPKVTRDALAAMLVTYGEGRTGTNNWKFFNIFVLSHLKNQGYKVNETIYLDLLTKTLEHYRGDGWYKDRDKFDYYSMWAFNLYGMLWADFYGKEHYPEFAKKFTSNFSKLKNNYPYMFSRKGEMIMWGRSISYRFGAVSPFPMMGLENDKDTNYGWMRRIASGSLLQFLQNPNFLEDEIPTLGFYGHFDEAVQSYSCRGSVFWCGKAFLGLVIPENNTFWQATENEGAWENELKMNTVSNKYFSEPNILITDYPNIGASEIRAFENDKPLPDYNRLSYNSAFPWQADGKEGQVSMNYLFNIKGNEWKKTVLIASKKPENSVYYRDLMYSDSKTVQLHLAEVTLPNGILRVDQNCSKDTMMVRLGHYSLPKYKTAIKETIKKINGHEVRIIDNGVYQLAMVNYSGFEGLEFVKCQGLNPVAEESSVINAFHKYVPNSKEKTYYVTLMLWKKSDEKWTEEELIPIKSTVMSNDKQTLKVIFKNGDFKIVNFN